MKKCKAGLFLLLTISVSLTALVSCNKDNTHSPGYGNAPRTNPMPAALSYNWQMTTSGSTYQYDGVYYGNSGRGEEINIKTNGTGWWNSLYQIAGPDCVQVQNLSADCTFEVHQQNGRDQLYVYITGGTLHEEKCASPDVDIDLKAAGKTYPDYPAMVYDYKIVTEDNDPSLKLLLLSQEQDENIRFNPHYDTDMLVLKLIQ